MKKGTESLATGVTTSAPRMDDDDTDRAAVRSRSQVKSHNDRDKKYQHSSQAIATDTKRRTGAALKPSIDPYTYSMAYPARGDFIIINNIKFDEESGQSFREGAEADATALKEQFSRLGFNVIIYTNLDYIRMRKVFDAAGKKDHGESACFGCALLSHGDEHGIWATDMSVRVDDLVKPMKQCASLYGKPKIFFIQACRGVTLDDGIRIETDGVESEQEPRDTYAIPSQADFLFVYASPPGYRAFRRKHTGCWFISCLCDVLREFGTSKDILWLLTRVNYQMALEYESRSKDPAIDGKKQVGSIVTQLTKQLCFY